MMQAQLLLTLDKKRKKDKAMEKQDDCQPPICWHLHDHFQQWPFPRVA